jgi:large subunit ribosomal protein L17
MRHGKKINHLGRTASHRGAMLSNMAISLIIHKRINTTLAKAKALRRFVEPLITKGLENTTHSRRVVFSTLQSKEAIKELFGPVAEKIGNRPGGYVRVIKMGFRRGDGAELGMIELVDFNEVYSPKGKKEENKKKTRRSRRSSTAANAAAAAATTAAAAPVVAEDVVSADVAEATDTTEETQA